jgi:hypothetical protein
LKAKSFIWGKTFLKCPQRNGKGEASSSHFNTQWKYGCKIRLFLKSALNEVRKYRGLPELDAIEFLNLAKDKMKLLELPEDFLKRSVNEGFSGGEKKEK